MKENSGILFRLLIGAAIVLFSLFKYFSSSTDNEITGEKQRISISKEQEIALGANSAPQMAQEFGGLYPDKSAQKMIDSIGQDIVNHSVVKNTGYPFNFYLLADAQTVNAFALPGGKVFITVGLLSRLKSTDQLAGVLGHEIGHVAGRHSAEQMAKQELTQGIAGAAGVVGGDYNSQYYAQVVANMVNLKYGREDELEADDLGVRFMKEAGYNPTALLEVMDILETASGGSNVPEFQSTHPSPANRKQKIETAIEKYKNEPLMK